MKFGLRKPSLKRSLKARTTGRAKRAVKKALIPGYGKKGVGWIKNPKKSLYNKVYRKTTFGVGDLFRFSFGSKKKNKTKRNTAKRNDNMEHNENVNNIKTPFYKKKWFIILVSVFVPVAGIVFVWKSKSNINKGVKIGLTAVASFWSVILLAIGFGGGETAEETTQPETTTAIIVESTTVAPVESTTAEIIEESTTEASTTEESTTQKATTTAAPTTTKKVTTTTAPTTKKETTTKKVTTTAKPTTTKKVTENPEENIKVYRTKTGEKYHYENPCGNGTYYEISLAEAKRIGLGACEKCVLQ